MILEIIKNTFTGTFSLNLQTYVLSYKKTANFFSNQMQISHIIISRSTKTVRRLFIAILLTSGNRLLTKNSFSGSSYSVV